jgi:thiamine kinase-like enzyme
MTPEEICARHNILIISLTQITHSHNNLVYDINDAYILRINEKKGFAHEFEMLKYLESKNIPVPKVIYHGDSYIILKKIKGNILSDIELSNGLYKKIGVLYRKVHDLEGAGAIFHQFINTQMEKVDQSSIEDELKAFILDNKPSYTQNVFLHCDPALANILVTPEGEIYLIDFEWSRFGDKDYDLASFETKHEQKYIDSFRKGYALENYCERSILFYKIIGQINLLEWATKKDKLEFVDKAQGTLKQLQAETKQYLKK